MIEANRSRAARSAPVLRAGLRALLVVGCRIDLDHADTPGPDAGGGATCATSTASSCMDAVGHSDLTWIQDNILTPQCTFSGCHNGASTPAGMIDLRGGMAYAHLVGAASALEPTRKLVVAGNPAQSYLEVMLGTIAPEAADPPADPIRSDVGTMPMSAGLLCCQKLDAVDRWIAAGAMND
jgi:hypothetical protein